MSGYQPGRCNIGRRQRTRRAAIAVAAFVVAALYVAAYIAGFVPEMLLLGVFVPLFIGFEWALQAYNAFCVHLALLGRYDFHNGNDDRGDVNDPTNREADRIHAVKITASAVVAAAAVTVVLAFAV